MFERLRTRIATWQRYRHTIRVLSRQSDQTLADAGIDRADICWRAAEAHERGR